MNLTEWLAPAAATGIGSLPGTDVVEAAGVVFGECELPYLPELPARGPGADMVGRTMARLAHVDPAFSMTTTPSGWRLTDRPGREVRRAMSFWGEDLDAVLEADRRDEWARFRGGVMFELGGHIVDPIARLMGRPAKVSVTPCTPSICSKAWRKTPSKPHSPAIRRCAESSRNCASRPRRSRTPQHESSLRSAARESARNPQRAILRWRPRCSTRRRVR